MKLPYCKTGSGSGLTYDAKGSWMRTCLRAQLRHRAAFLRQRLGEASIATPGGDTPIIPVVIGGNHRTVEVAGALQADGFDVSAVRPPTVPSGTARLRVSVHVDIAEVELDRFASRLAAVLKGQVPCPVASS